MNNHERLIRGMLLLLVCLLIYLGVNFEVSDTVLTGGGDIVETGEPKKVYLTFDDGPSKNTEKVLDILKEYNAVATFFVIGDSSTDEFGGVFERMVDEGHAIGLHCSCHSYNSVYNDDSSCITSILDERDYLLDQFGIESTLCRLPGGSANIYIRDRQTIIDTLHSEGIKLYDWNVSAEDSVGVPTAESIMESIFPTVYDYEEPIILLHDGVVNNITVEVLPEILEKLTEYGYEFATLEERDEFFYK